MTRKNAFIEGWSWFKFNNLGLALVTNLKFYTSLSKGLKLRVRRFWGLIPTFVEVTGEKLVEGAFPLPPILNRVKVNGDKKLNKVFQKSTLEERFFFSIWINFQVTLALQELPLAYLKLYFLTTISLFYLFILIQK